MASRRVISTSPTFGKYVASAVERLSASGCDFRVVGTADRVALLQELAEAEAWVVGSEPVTADLLAQAPALRVVAKHGVGVENIDLAAASERGIVVTFTPGQNSEAVADLAIGLILAVARDLPRVDRRVRAGEWPRLIGEEVWSRCLGIVGFGSIGKAVARRARGFSMRIYAYDVVEDRDTAEALGVQFVDLETLLGEADFVTVHVPLTGSTRALLGERELALMKPGAFLINTARGGVVDEPALVAALKGGRLAGAGLDVFAEEPPAPDNPLFALDNVVVTPHYGAYTRQSLERMGMACAEGIIKVLDGEAAPFIANPIV